VKLLRRTWNSSSLALLAALTVIAMISQWQPLADIIAIGLRDQEQSHIFLAPVVAIYLVWLRRSRTRLVSVQRSVAGPILVVAGWLVSWWGFRSGTQIAWHGGALLTIVGAPLSMTGLAPIRRFAAAFFVLLFALPIPGEIRHLISLPLQEMATNVTHAMLEFIGVSAVKSGNVLILNGEQVAVGEACNGMRMVFALSLVVFAFSFGTPLKPGTRLLLIGLSPAIAMLCNVVRLLPTSLIYGYGDATMAQNFHELAGWVMLPVALGMMAGVLQLIKWLEFPVLSMRLANQTT
jgi:exosortase